jgi:hypothetical protein
MISPGVLLAPIWGAASTGEIHSFGVFAPGRRAAGASRVGCLPPDTGSNKGTGRGRAGGFVVVSGCGRRRGGLSVMEQVCHWRAALSKVG